MQIDNNIQISDKTGFNDSDSHQIEAIEAELYDVISDSEGVVRDMCCYTLDTGGKKLRPLLVLYWGNMFSADKNSELIKAAVAAELIHMASLVHDDIIDNSPLRRSKPSVKRVWGNHYAVLCGDYLFAKAFGLLSGGGIACSMKYMVNAIQDMCHGEIMQASEKFNPDIKLETYYNRIVKKTASFLANCCKAGAVIAGADESQTDLSAQYGMNLGYAFQIIDDIRDVCSNTAAMGKPAGEDLVQGDLTLPVILLLKKEGYSEYITHLIKKGDIAKEDMKRVRSIMQKTGVVQESCKIAENHIRLVKNTLGFLPESGYKHLLSELADKVLAMLADIYESLPFCLSNLHKT